MLQEYMEALGLGNAWGYAGLFVVASLLMLWRLEAMIERGLEGTALATIVTPFCSGLGNLIFVFIMARSGGDPREVVTNCLVNNVTNLTVLLGLPALLWGLQVLPDTAGRKARGPKQGKAELDKRISRLALLLSLAAAGFFAGAVWVLGDDGSLGLQDGLILTGLFVFWLCFQVFDVLKHNVRQKRGLGPLFVVDLLILLAGAALMYGSLDWLVTWIGSRREGFVSAQHLGWLSGWLMVLPNALLVIWYAARGRADIAYASQVGDGHICIPLCLGAFALLKPLPMPAVMETGVLVLVAASVLHFAFVAVWGGLPRWAGWLLLAGYGVFLWKGLA
jgi:cation:H+ antiporter